MVIAHIQFRHPAFNAEGVSQGLSTLRANVVLAQIELRARAERHMRRRQRRDAPNKGPRRQARARARTSGSTGAMGAAQRESSKKALRCSATTDSWSRRRAEKPWKGEKRNKAVTERSGGRKVVAQLFMDPPTLGKATKSRRKEEGVSALLSLASWQRGRARHGPRRCPRLRRRRTTRWSVSSTTSSMWAGSAVSPTARRSRNHSAASLMVCISTALSTHTRRAHRRLRVHTLIAKSV